MLNYFQILIDLEHLYIKFCVHSKVFIASGLIYISLF